MIKTLGLAILWTVFSSSAGAAEQCSQVFVLRSELSTQELQIFKSGQSAYLKSLYQLYLLRPDFRLQTLEVPGMSMQFKDGAKALRMKEDLHTADSIEAQNLERSRWEAFAHLDRWKKQNGPSQILAQKIAPSYLRMAPIPVKPFSLPDIDFEMSMAGSMMPGKATYSEKLIKKYPALFKNRSWVEGETSVEQSWHLSYQNLMHYLRAILNTPAAERKITLTPEQLNLLRKIYDSRGEYSQLKFVDGKTQPDVFKADNIAHRLAVTGDRVGSDIFINRDIQDSKMDIAAKTGILLHELGHHHGYKDTADRPLDKAAVILTDYIRQTSEVKTIQGPLGEQIQLILFRPLMMDSGKIDSARSGLDAWGARVVLFDGVNYRDLTAEIIASIPNYSNSRLNFFSLKDFEISIQPTKDPHPRKQTYGVRFDLHFVDTQYQGTAKAWREEMFMALTFSKEAEKPGIVTWPILGVSVFPVRMTSSEFAPAQRLVPAKVIENQILTPKIVAGELAKLRAVVELPSGVGEIRSTWLDFSSDKHRDMIGAMPNQTHQISENAGDKIQIRLLSGNLAEVLVETLIRPGTPSQALTLEGINFIYSSGDFSFLRPKFKQTLQITEKAAVLPIQMVKLDLGGGQIKFPEGMPNLFNIFNNNSPAEVRVLLKNFGQLSHAILIADVDRSTANGFLTHEGVVVNFAGGPNSITSHLVEESRRGDELLLNFAVSTHPSAWGFGTRRVHVESLYLRDTDLKEIYIPFGTNFSIFFEN